MARRRRQRPLPGQHVGHLNQHKIFGPRGTMRYNVPPNWLRKHQNAVQFEVWRLRSPLRLPRGNAYFVRLGEALPPMAERQSVVYLAMVLLRQPARIL